MAQGREKGTTAEREVGKKNGKIMVCWAIVAQSLGRGTVEK